MKKGYVVFFQYRDGSVRAVAVTDDFNNAQATTRTPRPTVQCAPWAGTKKLVTRPADQNINQPF